MINELSSVLQSGLAEVLPPIHEHAAVVAKGISDLGMMAITAAFFLILSGILWVLIFYWFKSLINSMIQDMRATMSELLHETRKQNDMLNDISEGLRTETRERLKTLSGSFFDLAVYKILSFIKRVKKENHISDKDATKRKIKKSVSNLHSDRKSKFDNFSYRGKKLSEYVNPDWIDMVSEVVEKEVYDQEPNDDRAYTNVKNAYDEIKVDFYNRLKTQ